MPRSLLVLLCALSVLVAPPAAAAAASDVAHVHVSHDQTVNSVLHRGLRVAVRCDGDCGVGLEFMLGRRVLGSRIDGVARRTSGVFVELNRHGRRVLRGRDHFHGRLIVRSNGRVWPLTVRLGCP